MITAYEDKHVRVVFEETKFGWFMHVDILKWSHHIFLNTLLVFEAIKAKLRKLGVSVIQSSIPPKDKKNEKSAQMYGFEPTDNAVQLANGSQNRIWIFNLEEI